MKFDAKLINYNLNFKFIIWLSANSLKYKVANVILIHWYLSYLSFAFLVYFYLIRSELTVSLILIVYLMLILIIVINKITQWVLLKMLIFSLLKKLISCCNIILGHIITNMIWSYSRNACDSRLIIIVIWLIDCQAWLVINTTKLIHQRIVNAFFSSLFNHIL